MASAYPEAMPHGDLARVFDGVYLVKGTTRPQFMGRRWQFSRNMVVLQHDGVLTLVNTVRLDEKGLADLEALGSVRAVVRLGAFHGMDDAFYLERYGAALWALPGMAHEHGRTTDRDLTVGGDMPLPHASLFVFETAAQPEGLLLLEREGGILVSCDSLQNWRVADEFFDDDSRQKMKEFGFLREANVGPGWRQASGVRVEDFRRLEALSFRHLLSAHGEPLLHHAHARLMATFRELFATPTV